MGYISLVTPTLKIAMHRLFVVTPLILLLVHPRVDLQWYVLPQFLKLNGLTVSRVREFLTTFLEEGKGFTLQIQ